MKLKAVMVFACVLLSAWMLAQVLSGSSSSGQGVFRAVPKEERQELREAVEKFLTLRKAGNWDGVYSMLFNEQHTTKDEFLKQMKNASRLVSFTPSDVKHYAPANAWVLTGCALFEPPPLGRKRGVYATLYAHPASGSWLFSDVAVAVIDDRGRSRPCNAVKAPSRAGSSGKSPSLNP